MEETDIIIIGGGASGLMAARILSKAGKKVVILEARNRLGGRIYTLEDNTFTVPAETGAEFIHGDLPVTIGLLKEAGIKFNTIEGDIWRQEGSDLKTEEGFVEGGDLLAKTLEELKEDITIADFLDKYFSDEKYTSLRNSVKGFVEGYDAADTTRASAFAFRQDWSPDDEDKDQYRPNGGYNHLIRFLENECKQAGCVIHLSALVKEIRWEPGSVEVVTDKHSCYKAKKAIITLPLGVLQASPEEEASIVFKPVIVEKMKATGLLGYGSVIKILLEFRTAFWTDKSVEGSDGKSLKNLGWLFSSAEVPTWWTQLPEKSSLITGWLAGPRAKQMKDLDDEQLKNKSLRSLSELFNIPVDDLTNNLSAWRVINWVADPFALGAYSFSTIETPGAIESMIEPVNNTLFFAGEALHDGPQMGTVEGALASGESVANKVTEQW